MTAGAYRPEAAMIKNIPYRRQNLGRVGIGVTKRSVEQDDIDAAQAYLADVHNNVQMESACAQLRPEVRREMARRGLLARQYA
jgi:hypothetical protein